MFIYEALIAHLAATLEVVSQIVEFDDYCNLVT